MELYLAEGSREELARQIASNIRADYVYMYPPRQAYRPLAPALLTPAVTKSLDNATNLNLYFHFPFCEQICAFCNLFAVSKAHDDLLDVYLCALVRELEYYAPLLAGKAISTIYLGGGTPSIFEPRHFARLFDIISDLLGVNVHNVPEVALEVSPSTVRADKFREFNELGINRVNLGFQSLDDKELSAIGRAYGSAIPRNAIEIVQNIGFRNVCVDLIYGLEGQDFRSWQASVDEVIEFGPPTVCAYALTLRPRTGFAARGYQILDGAEQYAKYDYVNAALKNSGYAQETNVRWVRGPNGGYIQKQNHWALEAIMGFGAGARGYLWECDYRNGYSVRHRMRALRDYLNSVDRYGHGRTDGFLMDDDERRRKAVILGLIDLNRLSYRDRFGGWPEDYFHDELRMLNDLELTNSSADRLRLTALGIRHRDLLVQQFFSPRVQKLLKSFNYDE